MKIHYFQRYHAKENVATANTMLLLSRLYSYSPDKFFRLLKTEFFPEKFEPEIQFKIQEKSVESIPDATITQEGFKLVVETKMSDWFYSDQLMRHLEAFGEAKNKFLITIAPELMDETKKKDFEQLLEKYNEEHKPWPVLHINTTFEKLANAFGEVIEERDYEMQDVLEDYLEYCYHDGLIPVSDSWKYMRMQLAGTTLEFNARSGVYYDNIDRSFRAHDYLGLYSNKTVRYIGKVTARVLAVESDRGIQFEIEYGELTEERKEKIALAIADGDNYGYNLHTEKHRYFFVDQFYETDFKKSTSRAPMGSRIFDLSQILGADRDTMPDTAEIAERLRKEIWT
ncbi:MAG: hypothetical protein LUE29_04285 [Lachnospiraceae bacterium]|nr:hypothetical protein [Lachnospiraceae bacterium]